MAKFSIPVTKAKASVEVDTDVIPEDVYAYALQLGLKELVNRGMTKITVAKLEGEELSKAQAAALAQAEKNVEAINAGTVRKTGAKAAGKASGATMTEAMRLARALIKDQMKAQGIKVSHVEASEITRYAKQLVEADSSLLETAKANIEARSKATIAIDVTTIKTSPKLVAAAEAKKKAPKDGTLSAKQAGKPALRQKPGKPQAHQGAAH